jgi:hypothetical protein
MTIRKKLVLCAALVVILVSASPARVEAMLGFCSLAYGYGDCWSDGIDSQVFGSCSDPSPQTWCSGLESICIGYCCTLNGCWQSNYYCWDDYPNHQECEFGCTCYW